MVSTERKSSNLAGRSDFLPSLRTFVELRHELRALTGPIASYPVVIDANILIGELLWLSRKRSNPHGKPELLECLIARTIIAYVTSNVVVEVERNMERLATKHRIPADIWTSHWAAYKPLLHIEDPDPVAVAKYANCRDPTDAPTLALADLLAVCGILSEDKDVKAMGGKVIPTRFKLEARDYSRNATVFVSLQIGSYYVAVGAVETIQFAAKRLGGAIERFHALPDAVKITVLLAIAAALLHPRTREAILGALAKASAVASDAFPAVMAFLLQAAQIFEENRAIPPAVRYL